MTTLTEKTQAAAEMYAQDDYQVHLSNQEDTARSFLNAAFNAPTIVMAIEALEKISKEKYEANPWIVVPTAGALIATEALAELEAARKGSGL